MVEVHHVGGALNASGNVILLHGLEGDWEDTWSQRKSSGFWPSWLSEDQSDLAVWCAGYPAAATRWRGKSMPIRDRATSLLSALADGHEATEKPFILLGHSLGGLLIKQMIRHSHTMGDQYSGFTDQLAGVIFISTPHTGSGLASLAGYLRSIRSTPLFRELESDHAYLRELDDWYRNYATRESVPCLSFYEKQLTNGLRVVGESSGDPHLPGSTAIPVDANHKTISKFSDRLDLTYVRVRRFAMRSVSEKATDSRGSPMPQQVIKTSIAVVHSVESISPSATWSDANRVAELALLALLSEQLPTGGWTRSLAHWMTSYAEASTASPPDRPAMRVHGGIDVTCAALNRIISLRELTSQRLHNALKVPLQSGSHFLRTRTPSGGAVGATIQTRTTPSEVRVRHTAITLSTLIRLQRSLGESDPYPEVIRCASYLTESLDRWRQDTSGTFGVLAASWGLLELLVQDHGLLGSHLAEELQHRLSTTVEEIAQAVADQVSSMPPETLPQKSCARFGTYGNLPALAQSSFLFGASQLISLGSGRLPVGLAQQRVLEQVLATCRTIAETVTTGQGLSNGLLSVPTPEGPQPDIGLSIQALSIFERIRTSSAIGHEQFGAASNHLRHALISSFNLTDESAISRRLRFTHGVALAGLFDEDDICQTVRAENALHLIASISNVGTLSQRAITSLITDCAGYRSGHDVTEPSKAWGRCWGRVLEGGYYPDSIDESIAKKSTTWCPHNLSIESILALNSVGNGSLWSVSDAELCAGIPPTIDQIPVNVDTDWRALPINKRYNFIYLSTAATSSNLTTLLAALRFAHDSMVGPDSIGVFCVRIGDHRLVTDHGERVLFVESTTRLEQILNECGLRMLSIDNRFESIDGVESVVRFGQRSSKQTYI
ncbi:hypothetical protein GCM10027589_07290 [Actinocorallia lasiicapitis]